MSKCMLVSQVLVTHFKVHASQHPSPSHHLPSPKLPSAHGLPSPSVTHRAPNPALLTEPHPTPASLYLYLSLSLKMNLFELYQFNILATKDSL